MKSQRHRTVFIQSHLKNFQQQFNQNNNPKWIALTALTCILFTRKGGQSPGAHKLWMERKQILKPEKTRIVGRGKDNERLQEYRPSQKGRKRIAELKTQIYNRFVHYCETLGTTPLKKYQQNNHESWLNNNLSDGESQVSLIKQQKCPVISLKKFKKHETVNLIRLKQTVKSNTMETDHRERTAETKTKAEKDFALDLPLLVDETARDEKIVNAITAIEKDQLESIFYPYRPHRSHLTTRIDRSVTMTKLYCRRRCDPQSSPCYTKDTRQPQKCINRPKRSGGQACTGKYARSQKIAQAAGRQVRI